MVSNWVHITYISQSVSSFSFSNICLTSLFFSLSFATRIRALCNVGSHTPVIRCTVEPRRAVTNHVVIVLLFRLGKKERERVNSTYCIKTFISLLIYKRWRNGCVRERQRQRLLSFTPYFQSHSFSLCFHDAYNYLCFFFVFLSRGWHRADLKHLIIFVSSLWFFYETGTGPTENI